jgi:hypothetical protein
MSPVVASVINQKRIPHPRSCRPWAQSNRPPLTRQNGRCALTALDSVGRLPSDVAGVSIAYPSGECHSAPAPELGCPAPDGRHSDGRCLFEVQHHVEQLRELGRNPGAVDLEHEGLAEVGADGGMRRQVTPSNATSIAVRAHCTKSSISPMRPARAASARPARRRGSTKATGCRRSIFPVPRRINCCRRNTDATPYPVPAGERAYVSSS